MRRDRGEPWTTSDVPLLDELAELLGEDDEAQLVQAARAALERKAELEYARETADASGGGIVTAEQIVDRYSADITLASVGERAAVDRTWTYGHVVVDEAQELSAMAWRAVLRRCPTRSMTVVGDLDQSGHRLGLQFGAHHRPVILIAAAGFTPARAILSSQRNAVWFFSNPVVP